MTDDSSTEVTCNAPALGSALGEGTVTIEVGPEHKKFYVHKALLVHHSEYFKRALRGAWKEAREGHITLEDVEPATFSIFIHWLYTQQVPESLDFEEWDQVTNTKATSALEDAMVRAQAYSFGDRFLVPSIRRAMNKAFVELMASHVQPDAANMGILVKWAFENISSDRPLLQLLVNQFCDEWHNFPVSTMETNALRILPGSFMVRLIMRYNQIKNYPNDDIQCCYIEHTDDELGSCKKSHMVFHPNMEFGSFA